MLNLKDNCVLSVGLISTVLGFASAACCLPDQWTANLVHTVGEYNRAMDSSSLAYDMGQFFYDYTGRQTAYFENLDNRTAHVKKDIITILKYNEGKKYTIQNKTCKTEDVSIEMESPCIPEDSTFFGAHTYPSGVKAHVWLITNQTGGGSRRISVTPDDCLPLSESRLTGGPDYIMRGSLMQNVTKGIADPTAFNIPAICKHAADD